MMKQNVWLIVLEEGAYSDYSAVIGSAWTTASAAREEKIRIEAAVERLDEVVTKWNRQRNKLWDELKPGSNRFWNFSSEEKKREWHAKVPELSERGIRWDAVSVVEAPLNTPGRYWVP